MERKKAFGKDLIWVVLLGTLLLMLATGWVYQQQLDQINCQIEGLKQEELK